ncbi:hypothetical protein AB1Y20_009249 [Prymnesium parvum]|uniref:Uncharacterized protein n=1 Tax=Prymnesium parvum TaxID=97485 RepID=A0AB34K3U3_PRYPA
MARKKGKPDPVESSSEEEEEVEEVESEYAKRKKEKSRKAFMKLCRSALALVPLITVVSQQDFMYKERQSGVNAAKLVPLQLAVSGVLKWAKTSPTTLRNPVLHEYINMTARGLLTPYEYGLHNFGKKSKRAMPAEKTWSAAWKKSKSSLNRVAEGDAAMRALTSAPFPNVPLIGAYLLVPAALFAFLVPNLEYIVVVGCGMILQERRPPPPPRARAKGAYSAHPQSRLTRPVCSQGARGFGMEPQPELYVTGVAAVIGIICLDASKKKSEAAKAKRR